MILDASGDKKRTASKSQVSVHEFFKRPKTYAKSKEPVVKRKKYPSDVTYFCLKCKNSVSRGGRDYYKTRHMQLVHSDLDEKLANQIIVPEDHEDVVKIKKQKASKLTSTLIKDNKDSTEALKMVDENQYYIKNKPTQKVSDDEPKKQSEKQPTQYQRNITSFLNQNDIATGIENDEKEFDLESEINQIKLLLNSMTMEKRNTPNITSIPSTVNNVHEASNLLEVDSNDIFIDVLKDGCRVICVTCKEYYESLPNSSQR